MALTKRYVRADADGTGDGTTDANSGATGSFTWAQMITDLNSPRAGYKYLVKSGTYANGTTSTTLTGDGTTTSPNVIEGYNTTEGDLLANGRDSNGALDTTNFPEITYTGTTATFSAAGADYLIIRCLKITSENSNATIQGSPNGHVRQCVAVNNGTNASSKALNFNNRGSAWDCDFSTTAGSGPTSAVSFSNLSGGSLIGCRIKCPSGDAAVAASGATFIGCTMFESVRGIYSSSTSAGLSAYNCTVVNCTGDGVECVTGSTVSQIVVGCHITGCGGYGIDFNTSTCQKTLCNNRFRDNTSGNVFGGGDWEEGTSVNNVTSDDTDALDFTDQANDNYSLLTTAAAITSGLGYRNPIGAHGAGSFPAGGGGSALHLGGLGQTGIGQF